MTTTTKCSCRGPTPEDPCGQRGNVARLPGPRSDPQAFNAACDCIGCGASVGYLEVFPGPRCLPCWEPIGNAEARTMTAEKLTRMWGGGR